MSTVIAITWLGEELYSQALQLTVVIWNCCLLLYGLLHFVVVIAMGTYF